MVPMCPHFCAASCFNLANAALSMGSLAEIPLAKGEKQGGEDEIILAYTQGNQV